MSRFSSTPGQRHQPSIMSFYIALCLTVLRVYCADAVFQVTDCSPPGAPISVSNIQLSPDPITMPGDITVSFDGLNNATINDASLQIDVSKDGAHIGCILGELGSCNYADLCHLLPKMQKENWLGVMGGIATQIESALIAGGSSPTCPFTPGALHISGQTFHLPEVPSFLLTLAHVQGSYHFQLTIKNNQQQVLFCLKGDVDVNVKSGGFLFG